MLQRFLNQIKLKPVIDDASRDWLLEAFAWALRNADADVFYRNTQLVLPTPEFFPDRSQSAGEMMGQVLGRVTNYAHMEHWPFALLNPREFQALESLDPVMDGRIRRQPGSQMAEVQQLPLLPLTCLPQQLNNPEALIGSLSQGVSYYLMTQIRELPPGGRSCLPQAVDLLGVFLGFGVMLANSAYTFRGGCGSCYNPLAVRSAALTEIDTVYALAIFCELKGIPASEVKPHLKKYLRPTFSRSLREVQQLGIGNAPSLKLPESESV